MAGPYVKQTWVNGPGGGTPRSASRLQHQEDGIKDQSDRLDAIEADYTTTAEAAALATSRAVVLAMVL